MSRRLYLFDDTHARGWAPFHLTRPAGELLYGCFLQRERWERVTGATCVGHLADPALVGFGEEGAPPVMDAMSEASETTRIVVSSRAVPTSLKRLDLADRDEAATLVVGTKVAGWLLPPGASLPSSEALLDPQAVPEVGERLEIDGSMIAWPWELVGSNGTRLAADISHLHAHGGAFLLTDVHILGDHPISLGQKVKVDPGVSIDVRAGPVRLDDGVRVEGPARLTGPLWVGRDSRILGGRVGTSSVGPGCKVKGEVDSSIFLGYANKAHDGYLGHAYVGRWVNLGADTVNSDLKNSYSPVRVPVSPERRVETGMLKVGCFLGDHVKTGIGTLINTGTVVGAGSNLFGGRMPPTWVPPFSWGSGSELDTYRIDKFLDVAATAMARRNVELDEGTRDLLRRAWKRSEDQRSDSSSA